MPVTSDCDFRLTRDEIITLALRAVGALDIGHVPDGDDISHCNRILNAMVKSWQARRTFLWTLQSGTAVLSDGTAYYDTRLSTTVYPIIALDYAAILDSSATVSRDEFLQIISVDDYDRIPDKTREGRPTCVFVSRRTLPEGASADNPKLVLWPVPDASYGDGTWYLKYSGVCALQDFDSGSGTGEFSAKWFRPLWRSLAADIAPSYGVPIGERRDLRQEAESAFAEASRGQDENDANDDCAITGAFDF